MHSVECVAQLISLVAVDLWPPCRKLQIKRAFHELKLTLHITVWKCSYPHGVSYGITDFLMSFNKKKLLWTIWLKYAYKDRYWFVSHQASTDVCSCVYKFNQTNTETFSQIIHICPPLLQLNELIVSKTQQQVAQLFAVDLLGRKQWNTKHYIQH